MVKEYWEFLSKEARARVIFGVVIAAVILVIAIPYFVSVLNGKANSEINTAIEVEQTEVQEEKADEKPQEEVAEEKPVVEADEAEETAASSNAAYVATAARQSTQASAGHTSQAASTAPAETVTRTTVDDRSAGDDGYTPTGIDDQGENADMETGYGGVGPDTNSAESEAGEV